jgi:hypothetical protein
MTNITQAPYITAGPGTGFVVTDSLAVSRVRYTDLLVTLSRDLQGTQGTQGSNTGVQGIQGVQGTQGWRGTQGTNGRGVTGSQGTSGSAVAQGAQGTQGRQGITGSQGTMGVQGYGHQGTNGTAVAQGAQGIQGRTGPASLALNTQILYNDNDLVIGDAALTWDKITKTITLGLGSTGGTTLIKGYYGNGAITVIGTEYSSGGPMLGYAVTPSTTATDKFVSATNYGPIQRSAYTIAGNTHKWFAGPGQTIAVGSAVTITKMMYLDSTGLTVNGNLTLNGGTFANAVPTGGIIMWSGGEVPIGWQLCDGASPTPDLRNRFIIGSGSTYSNGDTGGTKDAVVVSHTHGVTDPGHLHEIATSAGSPWDGIPVGVSANSSATDGNLDGSVRVTGYDRSTVPITISAAVTGLTVDTNGISGTNKNLPPYYALAFIMKL